MFVSIKTSSLTTGCLRPGILVNTSQLYRISCGDFDPEYGFHKDRKKPEYIFNFAKTGALLPENRK
jgi:hypothetical protein